ncbi:MAG: tetratricopeptide repeat protein [Proteobacteria bacterium]|nr:tetratricopeptide repeat protein [Pseudomonadota bacterium]
MSLFIALILLTQASRPAYSEEDRNNDLSAKSIASFADSLFKERDFYRAITEYKRLIFFYPQSQLSKRARLQIALAYMEGKKFGAAQSALEDFIDLYDDDEMKWQAIFYMAEVHYRAGDYGEAIQLFSRVESADTTAELKKEATVKKGWAFVKKGDWAAASHLFKTTNADEKRESIDRLSLELTKVDLRHKSPALAGTLSAVLPGAGQLYVGRKKDAAAAFLLNGAFILGAVEAFRDDKDVIGGILLFFEAGWYAGNIYSAIGGAHKYNDKQKSDYIYSLERRYSLKVNGRGDVFGLYKISF